MNSVKQDVSIVYFIKNSQKIQYYVCYKQGALIFWCINISLPSLTYSTGTGHDMFKLHNGTYTSITA
jgi:hypothetical protein